MKATEFLIDAWTFKGPKIVILSMRIWQVDPRIVNFQVKRNPRVLQLTVELQAYLN